MKTLRHALCNHWQFELFALQEYFDPKADTEQRFLVVGSWICNAVLTSCDKCPCSVTRQNRFSLVLSFLIQLLWCNTLAKAVSTLLLVCTIVSIWRYCSCRGVTAISTCLLHALWAIVLKGLHASNNACGLSSPCVQPGTSMHNYVFRMAWMSTFRYYGMHHKTATWLH